MGDDTPAVDVAAIRAETFPCCAHCPDDPEWHADNPKDTHETSCITCDRDNTGLRDALGVAEARAQEAEAALERVRDTEPTDRDIDASLKLLGYHADQRYPEWSHGDLRTAYREGWDDAIAAALHGVPSQPPTTQGDHT